MKRKLTEEEKARVMDAVQEFHSAFCDLAVIIDQLDEESFNEEMPKYWPFIACNQEMFFVVAEFCDAMRANIDNFSPCFDDVEVL